MSETTTEFFNAAQSPRISGTPEPTIWERLSEASPEWLIHGFDFAVEFSPYLFGIGLGILLLQILRNSIAVDRKQIEKLWTFIVFFLSKRHMMIPIVISLSKKKNILTGEQRTHLLEVRNAAKQFPLKQNPNERFKKELEVSKILFEYFQSIESSGELEKSKRLKKIVDDLEFIDEKLVELQVIYNREAKKWNTRMKRKFFLRNRVKPFFDFTLFDMTQK